MWVFALILASEMKEISLSQFFFSKPNRKWTVQVPHLHKFGTPEVIRVKWNKIHAEKISLSVSEKFSRENVKERGREREIKQWTNGSRGR